MEPWDLKPFEERTADNLPNFIIFCEDKVCEPIYFKRLENDKIKINVVPDQKTKIDNVTNAIDHCIKNGLMDATLKIPTLQSNIDQVWCVFDHDCQSKDDELTGIRFNAAIQLAEERGLKVAWSNDAFELWILLHLEEVDPNEETRNRTYYYDRLTQIFKSLENPNESLDRVRSHQSFCYKDNLKSLKRFRDVVMPYIMSESKIELAIQRAKDLAAKFGDDKQAWHLKSPCTYAFKLVEEINSFK